MVEAHSGLVCYLLTERRLLLIVLFKTVAIGGSTSYGEGMTLRAMPIPSVSNQLYACIYSPVVAILSSLL